MPPLCRRSALLRGPAGNVKQGVTPFSTPGSSAARRIALAPAPILPSFGPRQPFGPRIPRRRRVCVLASFGQKVHSRDDRARQARPTPVSPVLKFANGEIVIHSLLSRHAVILGIALALSFPSFAAPVPAQQLAPENAAGSYLAARHAGAE